MKLQVLLIVGLVGVCLAKSHDVPGKINLEKREKLNRFAGQYEEEFKREFKSFRTTGVKSERYETMISELQFPIEGRKLELSDVPEPKQEAICVICRSAVGSIIDYRRDGATDTEMYDTTMEICTALNLYPFDVCHGVISLNINHLLYIIDNRPAVDSEIACGLLLQGSNCVVQDFSLIDWEIEIDDTNYTPITGPKDDTPIKTDDDIQIIHITDFHYDPAYEVGMNAVCDEPACCRVKQGLADSIENAAGKWGDYRDCDTPWIAVQNTMDQIVSAHSDVAYVYYTGDIIDHGIWETTFDLIRESLQQTYQAFEDTFGDIPIFPALGNHEGQPVNQFGPRIMDNEELGTKWLYDYVADQWARWLPEDTIPTIEAGGYYTALVRPGLRVISTNNNHCYTYNWWTFYQPDYSKVQLQWIHDTLLEAELNGEKVHILAHIPSGEGSCFKVWAREYARIVDRFWNTISGQFNGHTHKDQFYVFYSRNGSHAINVGWNGGSATPYSDVNLNYRLYHINSDSYEITDHETYIYNLTEANLTPESNPRWFKSYTFSEEYNLGDLSPASLNGLVHNFAENPEELYKYWTHYVKQGDASLANDCTNECLADKLCDIVTTVFGESDKCEELLDIFWENFSETAP